MEYRLFKKTETEYRDDDGEEVIGHRKTAFYLIEDTEEEMDKFGEYQASECGYQDYSYKVDFKFIITLNEKQLKEIYNLIQNKLALEELEK